MGPLEQLFGYLQSKRFDETPQQHPHMGLLEQESAFAPRKGLPPRSFRDPQQGGPEPPVDPRILAQLFGQK